MDNSTLMTLTQIHATMLSIIIAILTAFFLYSYQVITTIHDKLNDLRYRVNIIMKPYFYHGACNRVDYISNNKIDYEMMKDKLLDLRSGRYNNIVEGGMELIGLTSAVSNAYPYDGSTNKMLEYNQEWHYDLVRITTFLHWISNSRDSYYELLNKYRKLLIKEQEELHEEIKKEMEEAGYKEDNVPKQIIDYDFPLELYDFPLVLDEFFNKITYIYKDILPIMREDRSKMELYKNKYKLKRHALIILLILFIIMLAGVLLPLFINIYYKPQLICKSIETGIVVFTLIPYFGGILYLLTKVHKLGIL